MNIWIGLGHYIDHFHIMVHKIFNCPSFVPYFQIVLYFHLPCMEYILSVTCCEILLRTKYSPLLLSLHYCALFIGTF